MKFTAPAIPDFKLLSKMYLADNNMPVPGMREPWMHRIDCIITISNPKSDEFCVRPINRTVGAREPIAGSEMCRRWKRVKEIGKEFECRFN